MTHFMAYVILLSAGIGAGALAVEFLLRARTNATRGAWVAALAAVLVVAGVTVFAPVAAVREVPAAAAFAPTTEASALPLIVVDDHTTSRAALRIADGILPTLWLVSSALLLATILYGQRRLSRERAASRRTKLNGREVLVTDNVGPAVAGVGEPVVLLPRWALALDAASQELLLAHEFEHVKKGDTRVLLSGAVAAALMPWNPVVWWISRRLRLAVEQDCDARVLREHPDVRRYADLLLMAASQPHVSAHLLAAHLGEHRSDLDRRIQAMTDNSLKWRPVLVLAAIAAGLIVASCEAPRPEPLAPRETGQSTAKSPVAEDVVPYEFQVEKAAILESGTVMPRYPEILREAGVEGEVLVSFVVDEQGKADAATLKIIRSTHELFATAVKQTVPAMRFVPAERGGKKVKQMVEQPFTFTLAGTKQSPADGSTTGTMEEITITGVPSQKRLAYTLRRNDREVPATPPNVVVYSIEGRELARGDDVLQRIDPQSIHSIEVYKPNRCPSDLTCPLIKVTLAMGKTLGAPTLIRPTQQTAWTPRKPMTERQLDSMMKAPVTVELLTSTGDLVARYGSRAAVKGLNSEDIAASEAYNGSGCKAGSPCPLTRIWLKPGREAAYRKR